MAIRKVQSSIFGGLIAGAYVAANSAAAQGKIMHVNGTVSNLATDNAGSTFEMCEVSSSLILLPESMIKRDGWGFAQCVIGVKADTTSLVNATSASGNAAGDAPIARFSAQWNKPIWQQLGLPEDPLICVTLIATAIADATGDGQLDFDLRFSNHV